MNEKEILEWIADIFEEPEENIQLDTPAEDIPAWDSLGVLNLMAALDEEYDILLSDEELQALRTVNDIITVFKGHGHI